MRALSGLSVILALAVPAFASAGQSATSRPRPRTALQRAAGYQAVAVDPAQLCETAATTAEYTGRLPPRLLGAISLTETGRVDPATGRIRPWPWTINAEGAGQFFDTREQAVAAVKALQARGVQSIDVGCMQVNLMYHPHAFASLDDAFDPNTNANYAARFLNALYTASKDWPTAIAAYHSETPELGDAYRVLVMARWHNADPHTPPIAAQSPYGDFAQANKAYGDQAYGAFAPRSLVYGAFAPH